MFMWPSRIKFPLQLKAVALISNKGRAGSLGGGRAGGGELWVEGLPLPASRVFLQKLLPRTSWLVPAPPHCCSPSDSLKLCSTLKLSRDAPRFTLKGKIFWGPLAFSAPTSYITHAGCPLRLTSSWAGAFPGLTEQPSGWQYCRRGGARGARSSRTEHAHPSLRPAAGLWHPYAASVLLMRGDAAI